MSASLQHWACRHVVSWMAGRFCRCGVVGPFPVVCNSLQWSGNGQPEQGLVSRRQSAGVDRRPPCFNVHFSCSYILYSPGPPGSSVCLPLQLRSLLLCRLCLRHQCICLFQRMVGLFLNAAPGLHLSLSQKRSWTPIHPLNFASCYALHAYLLCFRSRGRMRPHRTPSLDACRNCMRACFC